VGALQKPEATNVAGLRTWNSLGRFVKRGEKGIFILAPMIGKKRKEEETPAEEDKKSNGEARLYGFRAVYVFDRLSRDLWPSLCALDVIRQYHFRKSPR
jgi:antirestriction factor ArdC-like protein